ncbi:MAG: membrane dipeptidase [Candidatus Latescibacterota bacterium]|nr:membrane dipeptidase [Candidatus Latescibacterota bacterium]
MLLVDSHLDLAYNALEWDRDLTQPIVQIREAEAGMSEKGRGLGVVSFEELRRGEIGLFFVTVCCRISSRGKRFPGVRTQDIAYAKDRGQLAWYQLMETKGYLRQIRSRAELEAHLKEWDDDPQHCPLGFVLSMEGADGIVSEEQISEWWSEGLRVVSLCHYGVSSYAHGTQAPGGLTPRGISMLAGMQTSGMILDVSHLAEAAFWEALDIFGGAVLATHNCCRALCDHDRQLNDRQIQALVGRGGVIGTAFDDWMLSELWNPVAQDNSGITLETVVDHMDHICHLAGNAEHVAIGSDLDGGYGKEQSPADMETIADMQRLPEILSRRGYGDADIANVMHRNWIHLLRNSLP